MAASFSCVLPRGQSPSERTNVVSCTFCTGIFLIFGWSRCITKKEAAASIALRRKMELSAAVTRSRYKAVTGA